MTDGARQRTLTQSHARCARHRWVAARHHDWRGAADPLGVSRKGTDQPGFDRSTGRAGILHHSNICAIMKHGHDRAGEPRGAHLPARRRTRRDMAGTDARGGRPGARERFRADVRCGRRRDPRRPVRNPRGDPPRPRAAEAARKVTRMAQTVVDLTAHAHHDTVRAQDHLEFERFARADESYPLGPGEFAPVHLAAVPGMQPGTVAAMSDDVAALGSRTRGCSSSCTR